MDLGATYRGRTLATFVALISVVRYAGLFALHTVSQTRIRLSEVSLHARWESRSLGQHLASMPGIELGGWCSSYFCSAPCSWTVPISISCMISSCFGAFFTIVSY